MTTPKRNLKTAQKEAIEWLQWYDEAPNQQKGPTDKEPRPDPNHPAVRALRNFANTGSFSNINNQSLRDTLLQAEYFQLRNNGKNYEESVEILSAKKEISESSIGRRLKPAQKMPPEIEMLSGSDGLLKWMYMQSQRTLRSIRGRK
jgi:hypothetical protein